MAELNMDKMAKEVAEKALDDYVYQGKTIREWIAIIAKNAWIPVSERLPEEQGIYLVTIKSGDTYYRHVDLFNTSYKNGFMMPNVLAWMPLPEPYKEGESNAENSN